MQIIIEMPDAVYQSIKDHKYLNEHGVIREIVLNGTILPKGHGDLFDKTEILRFLRCLKYENCDWGNCFDCNKSRCINLNNVNDLVPIIEADTESEAKDE